MARNLFGGSAADVAEDIDGSRVPHAIGTVWDSPDPETANQVTDLTDLAGMPITQLQADGQGMIPQFLGPEDGRTELWVDFGVNRVLLVATNTGQRFNDHLAETEDPHGLKSWVEGELANLPSLAWIRKSQLPSRPCVDCVTDEPVRISTVQTNVAKEGYIKYAPDPLPLTGTDRRGPFTFLGAGDFEVGAVWPDVQFIQPTSLYPNIYGNSQPTWSVQFRTDARELQFMTKYVNPAASFYRIWIDGKRYTRLPNRVLGVDPGWEQMITLRFNSVKRRTIRIDLETSPFGGVWLPPGAAMWAAPARGPRVMVVGDSIATGSAGNTGWGSGAWPSMIGDYLGTDDVWNQARGGTGYVNPGGYATFQDRIETDVIPYDPDVLIIAGGYNDFGNAPAVISSAADALYAQIREQLPASQMFVVGAFSPTTPVSPGIAAINDALKDAAAAHKIPFANPGTGEVYDNTGALVAVHGPWITGTGNVANRVGDGVADWAISSDGIHPTDAGQKLLAALIAGFIREVVAP